MTTDLLGPTYIQQLPPIVEPVVGKLNWWLQETDLVCGCASTTSIQRKKKTGEMLNINFFLFSRGKKHVVFFSSSSSSPTGRGEESRARREGKNWLMQRRKNASVLADFAFFLPTVSRIFFKADEEASRKRERRRREKCEWRCIASMFLSILIDS